MAFYADLHLHSKYSRATSADCDLEHLSLWARKKGIGLLATGDFTHPIWREDLKAKLVPAEPGLYRLRPEIERSLAEAYVHAEPTRFMLEVEISTIYKKGERTRKVHHLIYAPDFDYVDRMVRRLAQIGNLNADGRPILGLDSRDLLEIVLESGPDAYLIPAHIWTPWFSAMGSRSGFDSIEECYGDLAKHIFAVETGLSSDPPMNRRLSQLDRFTLVSNSDAHSPGRLGRECCIFDCDMDYYAIRRALETREGFGGTVEFFPEEGKYHLDGHRKCGVCWTPAETRSHDARCVNCGKPVVVGVMHRVDELADRSENGSDSLGFHHLVPLIEILAELEHVGPQSMRVQRGYEQVLDRIGPELHVLQDSPLEQIARSENELLVEAIRRMREGRVRREPGYDGEFGAIRMFEPGELEAARAALPPARSPRARRATAIVR